MSTIPHDPSRPVERLAAAAVLQAAPYEQIVDDAIKQFEAAAERLSVPRAPTAELRDLCRKVAAYTADLVFDAFAIKVQNDPEIPNDLYFVFDVCVDGGVDEIVRMNDEWHRRLLLVRGRHCGLFRLTIRHR